MKKILSFIFFLGICGLAQQTKANIIYVDMDASGDNNGASWEHAYTDLQDALTSSGNSDTIWVAEGVYKPLKNSSGDANPSNPKTKLFIIHTKNVKMYGGFDGSENNLNERDWEENKTILSGEIGDLNTVEDNCYTVLYVFNSSLVLDGFTIQDGHANGLGSDSQDKKAGAGIYYQNKLNVRNTKISNCIIKDNQARSEAGLFVNNEDGTVNLTVSNTRITNNMGRWAPSFAVKVDKGEVNPIFSNCLVDNNIVDAFNTEGGHNFPGGRFISFGNNAHIEGKFINCTFVKNNIVSSGVAGVNQSVFGIQQNNNTSATINTTIYNTILSGNDVSTEGSIFGYDGSSYKPDSVTVFNSLSSDTISNIDHEYIVSNNCVIEDPLFKDITLNDFDLQFNSPAINAGDTTGISNYITEKDLIGRNRMHGSSIDIGCFEHPGTLNIIENDVSSNLLIYPNPAATHFMIETKSQIRKVVIRNYEGNVLIENSNDDGIIDINALHVGFYLVQIETNEGTVLRKLIKK